MPTAPTPLQAKALLVHQRLCQAYGCPIDFFSHKDPLSQLISSLLSQRTLNRDTGRAYRSLRAALPTWEAVRDAPVEQIQELIAAATWPEQKAPRIKAILYEITRRLALLAQEQPDWAGQGLSLDFLGRMPLAQARAWLETLPGVGPKTSAATLLFSNLRMPALPVDTHHYRVAQRLGLIEPGTSQQKAHQLLQALLPADWSAQQVYDHHEVLMLHGQRVCHYYQPECSRCVLLEWCPFGQQQIALAVSSAWTQPRPPS